MEITDGTEENRLEKRMIRQYRRGKVKNVPFLNTLPISTRTLFERLC